MLTTISAPALPFCLICGKIVYPHAEYTRGDGPFTHWNCDLPAAWERAPRIPRPVVFDADKMMTHDGIPLVT